MTSTTTSKRAVAGGVAVGLLGGAAAGMIFGVPGVSGATAPSAVVQQVDEPTPEPTPGDVAIPIDEVMDGEPGERLRETLQALVDDGTITAEQADSVTSHLMENRPERRVGKLATRTFGSGVVTDVLGIEQDDLREQLQGGSSLADIAAANDVDPQVLIDAMVAQAEERLTAAEADGSIDDAADKLATIEERITDLVNGELERLRGPGGLSVSTPDEG